MSSYFFIFLLSSVLVASVSGKEPSPFDKLVGNDTESPSALNEDLLVSENESGIEKSFDRPRRRHFRHGHDDGSTALEEGEWQVLNTTVSNQDNNKHLPSCILMKLKASIVVPIQNEDGEIIEKRIVIPKNATVKGSCGETRQWLTLYWSNTHDSGKLLKDGHLVIQFTKYPDENAIYMTRIAGEVALFLEDSGQSSIISRHILSQNILLSVKDVKLWYTPIRFSYICHHEIKIRLDALTLPVRSKSDEEGEILVDPIYREEAFLVVEDLQIEAFRSHRFGHHFTHLKYDCFDKWSYSYMPYVLTGCLCVVIMIAIVAFIFRRRIGCAPGGNLIEEEGFIHDEEEGVDEHDEKKNQEKDTSQV